MDELRWMTTENLDEMLKFLRIQPLLPVALVDRKLLYWIAEAVRVSTENVGAAALVEGFADGQVTVKGLRNSDDFRLLPSNMARFLHKNVPLAAQQMVTPASYYDRQARRYTYTDAEYPSDEAGGRIGSGNVSLIGTLRELFGNPWAIPNPDWKLFGGGIVRRLAEEVRLDGAWDLMPILGDALEDAGCVHADVLEHCRANVPHRKGCWVLDLIEMEE